MAAADPNLAALPAVPDTTTKRSLFAEAADVYLMRLAEWQILAE